MKAANPETIPFLPIAGVSFPEPGAINNLELI